MAMPQQPDESSASPKSRSRRRTLWLVATGVLLALGIWFALANTREVAIQFWVVTTRTSVVSALAIAAALGFGIGFLVARRSRRGPGGSRAGRAAKRTAPP